MSNSLDPDQARHFVGPHDLGPNCRQMLSADDTSRPRVKECFSTDANRKAVPYVSICFNCLPASENLCHLLITFANNLVPDQNRQNVWPDLFHIF